MTACADAKREEGDWPEISISAVAAPTRISSSFIRNAELAVNRWRFEIPPKEWEGYRDMYASIEYVPAKASA